MTASLSALYRGSVLRFPWLMLVALALTLAFFAYHAQHFKLDASADSLLLEGDRDLARFREVQQRYRTQDLLFVTFTPEAALFGDASLSLLKTLRDALRGVEGVASMTTILDVPLLKTADVSLAQLLDNIRYLEDPAVDRERAKAELLQSPVFQNLILSADAKTTALLLHMRDDEPFQALQRERDEMLAARRAGEFSAAEQQRLEEVAVAYDEAHAALNARRHRDIESIRAILSRYAVHGELHLGGVAMITDDMVTFIRRDLVVFGAGVLAFLVVVLGVIFRRARWVLLPLLSCFYAGLLMIGMLGLIGWKVTVISSNFLALMLIITISMNIHLTVRYRQLRRDFPDMGQRDLVATTVDRMVWPCLYTALTTIMGFSSLVFSGIKPVIDFGWMMSIGLAVTFITSFTLFPAVLLLLGRSDDADRSGEELPLTASLAGFTERQGNKVLVAALGLAIVSAVGLSRITVENSFINYFSKGTEIYKGMKLIDQQLGGTTPLEVLLDLDEDRIFAEPEAPAAAGADADDPDADLDAELDDEEKADPASYWFTSFKIDRIKAVHDYLAGLPEVGKVLSLASVVRVGEDLNDGQELDSLQLALIYKRIPDEFRESLIAPYVSFENHEARIMLRVVDSRDDLRRKELLERIHTDLREKLELEEADVSVSGLLVLYNNMLQSLYQSQISTIGAVLAGVAAMFLVLFRSLSLAIIGIVPNLLAAAIVVGMMGLLEIPLDMMTITIAAITIGIAVDNSIHYIYRFREEFADNGDYLRTLHICHANIGKAVLYTSATIIFGFSILVLSNFYPTIYFGLLTGLAMFIALLAALTLLPKLILVWKPFPAP